MSTDTRPLEVLETAWIQTTNWYKADFHRAPDEETEEQFLARVQYGIHAGDFTLPNAYSAAVDTVVLERDKPSWA